MDKNKYEAYTSRAVMYEIKDASNEKSEKMDALSQKHIKRFIEPTPEAVQLAKLYIKKGIIPLKFMDDALHIATAILSIILIL
jgi:hypothetical protein